MILEYLFLAVTTVIVYIFLWILNITHGWSMFDINLSFDSTEKYLSASPYTSGLWANRANRAHRRRKWGISCVWNINSNSYDGTCWRYCDDWSHVTGIVVIQLIWQLHEGVICQTCLHGCFYTLTTSYLSHFLTDCLIHIYNVHTTWSMNISRQQ